MRNVARLLTHRVLLALPILFAVVAFTFLLIRIGHNDPVGMMAGPTAGAAEINAIRASYKLDQPLWRQFVEFAFKVAQGDLGQSWLSNQPVARELWSRLPATLELVGWGALIGAGVGISVGMSAALHANLRFDHITRLLSLFGFGMPTIFLGLALIFVFFFVLGWAPPPMGRLDLMINAPPTVTGSYFFDALIVGDRAAMLSAAGRLVLPCLAVAIVYAAPLIKQTRAIAIDVLASDYVRYAHASGMPPEFVRKLVWRNASVPVITYAATELTALFGAASVLELIFSWGGISQYGLTAILKGDFAVVQGYVLVMSLIAMVVFALADLLVLWIEPRARSGAA
jgi:ABC-type dipeptide/oligopeptide/nickel transport system permease component